MTPRDHVDEAISELQVAQAETRAEQKWHRWLLAGTLAASAWGQFQPNGPPPPTAFVEWVGRVFGFL